jgi:AbrB family looped-hinge helix DNA binding protein
MSQSAHFLQAAATDRRRRELGDPLDAQAHAAMVRQRIEHERLFCRIEAALDLHARSRRSEVGRLRGRGKALLLCHFYGILRAMKTTVDAAGRIVVPKAMRQALGLKAGQVVDIRAGDGRLEIEIYPTPMRLKRRGKGVVAVPDAELPPLTADQVRDTLERVRR